MTAPSPGLDGRAAPGLLPDLAEVTVDPASRRARVGADASWGDVAEAAAVHGLTPIAASSPETPAIGFVLDGGLGPLGRTFGWAADTARAFEVVTGSGRTLVATPEIRPDLFWALRGGGHAGLRVTAMTVELLPLATVYAGGLYFGTGDAGRVLRAFADWSVGLPEEITASFACERMPGLELVPRPLRGERVVHVRVAAVLDPGHAERLLAPLRAAGDPLLDTVTLMPAAAIGSVHAGPPVPPGALMGGALLSGFGAAAAQSLHAAVGSEARFPLASVEVRLMGGALSRPSSGAVGGGDAGAHLFVSTPPIASPDDEARFVRAAERVFDALSPWSLGRSSPGFGGALSDRWGLAPPWPAEVRERLARIRDRYA